MKQCSLKRCTRCKKLKKKTDFYTDKTKKDNLCLFCKTCRYEVEYQRRNKSKRMFKFYKKTMKKKKTKKFKEMESKVLIWALTRLIKLNSVLIWLYTKDGTSGSAREWRYKLLRAIRVLVTDKEKHAELLEWMVESHGAFDSKNEWREEFINQLCRAAGL